MKWERQLDVFECSRNTVLESVHMGDPAVSYMEMVKARNSARGHLMAWHDKQAMQEHLKELVTGSNLKRKEYVMSLEANLEWFGASEQNFLEGSLQKYFDDTMRTPLSLMAYIANHCLRTDLQVRLLWCLIGIKKREYEATIETNAREQQLKLMGAFKVLIARDDSAIAWAKRKDASCFVKFVVNRNPTPVLEDCAKTIKQSSMKKSTRICHCGSRQRS